MFFVYPLVGGKREKEGKATRKGLDVIIVEDGIRHKGARHITHALLVSVQPLQLVFSHPLHLQQLRFHSSSPPLSRSLPLPLSLNSVAVTVSVTVARRLFGTRVQQAPQYLPVIAR